MHARHFTRVTVAGPFTYIVADGVVLASGWTQDLQELVQLIHPILRPVRLHESPDAQVESALNGYDQGNLHSIDAVRVLQRCGPFLAQAREVLRSVRPGAPISYTELARRAGRPAAVRAAAAACGHNATSLFVPCHRVLRSNGGLGGFRYGLPTKVTLLRHESLHAAASVGGLTRVSAADPWAP
ncbi:MAG TPA: methylated-DNA--[protein]-cysteine S-methyltransferase [Propionibacteriaceae bacterium]|nr:methylated-DNA--[protein]-cysteine S-methyltransferase [Propionibacteriaceae bacterium]